MWVIHNTTKLWNKLTNEASVCHQRAMSHYYCLRWPKHKTPWTTARWSAVYNVAQDILEITPKIMAKTSICKRQTDQY